jgi:hypothetical protein
MTSDFHNKQIKMETEWNIYIKKPIIIASSTYYYNQAILFRYSNCYKTVKCNSIYREQQLGPTPLKAGPGHTGYQSIRS